MRANSTSNLKEKQRRIPGCAVLWSVPSSLSFSVIHADRVLAETMKTNYYENLTFLAILRTKQAIRAWLNRLRSRVASDTDRNPYPSHY